MSSPVLSPPPAAKSAKPAKFTKSAKPAKATKPAKKQTTSPAALPPPFETVSPTTTGRKRWSRDEVKKMEEAGFLAGRYELLNGEIISKMGQNAPHSAAVMYVIAYLLSVFGRTRVRTQATMEVRKNDKISNRPEPDVFVLREALKRVAKGTDVLLVVEISDTTLQDDLDTKKTLYARAGVAEYWVLNVTNRRLFVFRNPQGDGWDDPLEFGPNDTVSCLAASDASVLVSELLD